MLLKKMISKTESATDADSPATLPRNVLADFLNAGSVQHPRHYHVDDYRIHVSELTKVGDQNMFCPRKFILDLVDVREVMPRRISPGFELLFETGNAYHDYARNKFIEGHALGKYAWGVWKCKCEKTSRTGLKPVKPLKCIHCKQKVKHYHEFSAVNEENKIVGHPDFLVMWKGVIYIYEIKTLDRADIDFDTLAEPLGDHQLQASFYYWLLRALGYKVSPMVRYLYIDRSTKKLFKGQPFKELVARVSPAERITPFINKAKVIRESRKSKVLPERICSDASCKRAKNCAIAAICFGLRGNVWPCES